MQTNKNIPNISWQSLTLGALIGNGSFGDVYQGTWNQKPVAIKLLQMKTLSPNLAEDFKKEAQMMWQCQSPHILTLHGICVEAGHYAMVMEYLKQGSLYQVLHNQTLSEPERWQIAIDMAKGLEYLHSQNILHRDFKSYNILLDDNYRAKISDFGLAKLKLETSSTSTNRSTNRSGTVRWKAPELFKRKAVATPASDIYSYGMVLWELITQKLPFEDASDEPTVINWVTSGEKEEIPSECPKVWKTLIEACWSTPEKRPSAKEMVLTLEAARPIEKPVPKSWHFEAALKPESGKDALLIPAAPSDIRKIQEYYQHHPVPGYDIKSVEVVYNPAMNRSFSLKMHLLQERQGNPAFSPSWQHDSHPEWRKAIDQQFQSLCAPYQDTDYSNVKLLPLWHGTSPDALKSILKTGYANLATTDSGFFGKGIYSAHEAEYAYRVYSKGTLVLNWVAAYSAYPVIKGDMEKLAEKANFKNYDAHFIPVIPKDAFNPKEVTYYPTAPQQKAAYHEVVVFNSEQCLPRYLVTLQQSLLKSITPKVLTQPEPKQDNFYSSPQKQDASLSPQKPLPIPEKPSPVLQFSPKPAAKNQPQVNPQELTKFLKLVAEGEQSQVETLLKQNKDFALVPGNVTDLSGRTFNNITGFQYALWALDWHMWSMIKKYMAEEDIRAQVLGYDSGSWIKQHGTSANWQNLVLALDTQIKLLQQAKWKEADAQWQREVGGAQKELPVHVVNEYCHPKRSFEKCPDFTQGVELPRTRLTYKDGEWFTQTYNGGQLGEKFAYCRGAMVSACAAGTLGSEYVDVTQDRDASRALLAARTQQREQLVAQYVPEKKLAYK